MADGDPGHTPVDLHEEALDEGVLGEDVLDMLDQRDIDTATLAVRMGYYESPRCCTMQDIADELGITKSAVYHRMSKVERRVLERLLNAPLAEPGSQGEPDDAPR